MNFERFDVLRLPRKSDGFHTGSEHRPRDRLHYFSQDKLEKRKLI